MSGIRNVADTFEEFITYQCNNRPEVITYIQTLFNSFEGWLKFEFYFWLITHKNLNPQDGDIGLEYKLAINHRHYKTKQCDLWVRDSEDGNKFHYIELKLIFGHINSNKMFNSAANDVWYMAKIKTIEYPTTGNCIALGINISDNTWTDGLNSIQTSYDLPHMQLTKNEAITPNGEIRWAAFTQTYE